MKRLIGLMSCFCVLGLCLQSCSKEETKEDLGQDVDLVKENLYGKWGVMSISTEFNENIAETFPLNKDSWIQLELSEDGATDLCYWYDNTVETLWSGAFTADNLEEGKLEVTFTKKAVRESNGEFGEESNADLIWLVDINRLTESHIVMEINYVENNIEYNYTYVCARQ